MSTFVLIHGAGSEAWYWHLLVPELEARGHEAVAPDLPSDDDAAGFTEYADAVVEAVGERTDLVLVAQSLGSPRPRLRARARLVILLAAMVPAPGGPPASRGPRANRHHARRDGRRAPPGARPAEGPRGAPRPVRAGARPLDRLTPRETMAAVSTERHPRIQAVAEEARVTPIELFFDLVFVFAITQVTGLMGDDPTIEGLVRGLLVLSLLWWCWVGYAWLGNLVRADEGVGKVAMFAAMAAMFVVALAVPEAFDDLRGGWSGPVVIALGYLAVRAVHLAILWAAASATDDAALRGQLIRWAPSVVGGTAILLVASQLQGTAQTLAWAAALVADYLGTILAGASGWRLNSAAHFAERHGLIVIIALGESIVAIGLGVVQVPVSGPIVAASVLGLTLAGAIWWAYFDVVSLIAERTLRRLRGAARARLARDAYSYLHLPMIAGIVLMALGLEEVLAGVAGEGDHTIGDPLATLPLVAMYCGVALFLVGHVAFTFRVEQIVKVRRLVAAAVMLALIPPGLQLPALGALALLVAVMVLLILVETIRFAEARERIRHEED